MNKFQSNNISIYDDNDQRALKIRRGKEGDLKIINSLMLGSKSHWGYDDHFMSQFMAICNIDSSNIANILIAEEQGAIVGFYSFIGNMKDGFQLDNFFVSKDFIGKGRGQALWKLCLQTAEDYKIKEFIIESDPNAAPFYLKMGCNIIGQKESPIISTRYIPILKYCF